MPVCSTELDIGLVEFLLPALGTAIAPASIRSFDLGCAIFRDLGQKEIDNGGPRIVRVNKNREFPSIVTDHYIDWLELGGQTTCHVKQSDL
jgi:hypothetical protein